MPTWEGSVWKGLSRLLVWTVRVISTCIGHASVGVNFSAERVQKGQRGCVCRREFGCRAKMSWIFDRGPTSKCFSRRRGGFKCFKMPVKKNCLQLCMQKNAQVRLPRDYGEVLRAAWPSRRLFTSAQSFRVFLFLLLFLLWKLKKPFN